MTILDLLFIVLFLISVVTLIVAAVSSIRGRREKAVSVLRRFAICFALYMGVVLAVALATPRKYVSTGDVRCFDDWCVTVSGADHLPSPAGIIYSVTLQLSSRARGTHQRANGVYVYLTDSLGRRFDPWPAPAATPLDVFLDPGQMVEAKRSFTLPKDPRDVGLVVVHGGSYCFPGCFIIGEISIVGQRTSSVCHKL